MEYYAILRGASIWVVTYFVQGWTYGLDGILLKATRIDGIQNFDENVCNYIILIPVSTIILM